MHACSQAQAFTLITAVILLEMLSEQRVLGEEICFSRVPYCFDLDLSLPFEPLQQLRKLADDLGADSVGNFADDIIPCFCPSKGERGPCFGMSHRGTMPAVAISLLY